MERVRKSVSNGAMTAMTLLYLLEVLTGLPAGRAAEAAAAVVLAVNLPVMGRTFRAPAWIFLLAGAGLLLAAGAPASQWLEGLGSMLKTAVILIVMQGLSLAMGIFSGAVQYSGLSRVLTQFCQDRQALLGPLVLPLLPAAVVLFSLAGLRPFVSVLMIGPILAGLRLPSSPLQLGLAMSLGCCLSYMLSPFAGLILALSGGLEEPPARICLRSNLVYALAYYAAAMAVICLLPG